MPNINDYIEDENSHFVAPGLVFKGDNLAPYSEFARSLWLNAVTADDKALYYFALLLFVLKELESFRVVAELEGIHGEEDQWRKAIRSWHSEYRDAIEVRVMCSFWQRTWTHKDSDECVKLVESLLDQDQKARIAGDPKPESKEQTQAEAIAEVGK